MSSSPATPQPSAPASAGDGEAVAPLDLGSLYGRHADAVARWAGRLAGPGLDVEDIVHEVFLVACRRLAEFRGDAKITTWLYEITVRVVQDRRRSQRRWSWLFGNKRPPPGSARPRAGAGAGAGGDGAGDELSRIPCDLPSALDLLERKEATASLYQILNELPEIYRTTIILFELEGLSGQEIADITHTSLSNVWIRLFRGRQKFLKSLVAREANPRAKESTP